MSRKTIPTNDLHNLEKCIIKQTQTLKLSYLVNCQSNTGDMCREGRKGKLQRYVHEKEFG
jgi:hypothetical protein